MSDTDTGTDTTRSAQIAQRSPGITRRRPQR